MPRKNQFRHQTYPTQPAEIPRLVELSVVEAEAGAGRALHDEFGVARAVLVHGTFMGDDPFGVADLLNAVASNVPLSAPVMKSLADSLRVKTREFMSRMANDIGNYSREFRDEFQKLVGDDPVIELLEPKWSGQNHHLARADLAVRLTDDILRTAPTDDRRLLLWGHSHAGNAFALLSNLLANDRPSVEAFFEAAGAQQGPHWSRVRAALAESPTPHPAGPAVIMVSFGTSVRYGWDLTGLKSLVHVLHHREPSEEHPYSTEPLFPPHRLQDVLTARFGDWVQAFAIAGTDVRTATTMSANDRLGAFLEASLPLADTPLELRLVQSQRIRQLCSRWKTGTRCHADGWNLLVNYQPCGRSSFGFPLENSLFGHGVATTTAWLPAHLNLVLETLRDAERDADHGYRG